MESSRRRRRIRRGQEQKQLDQRLAPQVQLFILLLGLLLVSLDLIQSTEVTDYHLTHQPIKQQISPDARVHRSVSNSSYLQINSTNSANINNRLRWAAVGDLLKQKSLNAFRPTAAALVAASNNVGAPSTEGSRSRSKSLHGILRSALASTSSGSSSLVAAASSTAGDSLSRGSEYRCAKYCSCSIIQVADRRGKGIEQRVNLTRAKCENSKFADVLTIDRRTQIIHISLPPEESSNNNTVTSSSNNNNNNHSNQQAVTPFRMPRLVQFNILREIVIVNLKFEVCDSEVFKRGQKLRRFQLNHNKLSRISKACLRYLEKLIELNLDHNELQKLESALFSSLLSLKTLSIAHNQLSELAAHQFANLTQLTTLNLVGNSFKHINLHLFEPMQKSLRMLILSKNHIKSFVHSPILVAPIATTLTNSRQDLFPVDGAYSNQSLIRLQAANFNNSLPSIQTQLTKASILAGVVFKNLIKLNVDYNKLERIKLLQLHRFFNVKFLSIRQNSIATIRDKAFNGLKLIELNLAHNKLQTISKCAFCNATIKRLVLSNNNISLPLPSPNLLLGGTNQQQQQSQLPRPLASVLNQSTLNQQLEPQAQQSNLPEPQALQAGSVALSNEQLTTTAQAAIPTASSSQNMLILSQSLFGPLFGQLEFLDLSMNELLADQLDYLLEPLLNLEYLNLASTGLDRSLVSPTIFKNLRQLKYLNLSYNQLNHIISETIEPLQQLEVLDLSNNNFSELHETFLVTLDDISSLKVINFGSNPWFCSQCKVAPLYDWILRSSIYNVTCIAPAQQLQQEHNEDSPNDSSTSANNDDINNELMTSLEDGGLTYSPRFITARGPQHDYSLLLGGEFGDLNDKFETSADSLLNVSPIGTTALQLQDEDLLANYNLLTSSLIGPEGGGLSTQQLASLQQQLLSVRDLISSSEDDPTISDIMANTLSPTHLRTFNPTEYCLRCEFPRELQTYNLHELSSGDFKFCAGAAVRHMASDPKIGLTLALVIIGALFCIIIVVIVMYRRKSNTYYTNEDTTRLSGAGNSAVTSGKKLMSVSSDVEHQYCDATDYSSPPMSQSYEESYTQEDEDEEDEDEEEYDENEEEEDEDENDEDELEVIGETEKSEAANHQSGTFEQRSQDLKLVDDELAGELMNSLSDQEHDGRNGTKRTTINTMDQNNRPSGNELETEQTVKQTSSHSSRSNRSPMASSQKQQQQPNLKSGGLKGGAGKNKSQNSMQSNHSIEANQSSRAVRSEKPLWAELSVTSLDQVAIAAQPNTNNASQNSTRRAPPKLSHSSGSQTAASKLPTRQLSREQSAENQPDDRKQQHNRHLAESTSFRLDSASNELAAKFSRVAATKDHKSRQGSMERRQQQQQQQQSDKRNRSAVKSPAAQTIYQLAAAGLQPSSQQQSPSQSTAAPNPNNNNSSPAQKPANNGRLHRPTALSQMNRHRFAISKEMSSQPLAGVIGQQSSASERVDFGQRKSDNLYRAQAHPPHHQHQAQHLVRGTTVSTLNRPEHEFERVGGNGNKSSTGSEDLLQLEPTTSRRGELHHMAHQANVRSPTPASDATTADSLAMEALDYGVDDEDGDLLGGALEMESSFEPDFELQPASGLVSICQDHLLQPSSSTNNNAGSHHQHQQQHGYLDTHSTHSALTQTGSKDLID